MATDVESMFYTRETPWHGLGTKVEESPCSEEALITAGLDWNVVQEPIYTETEELISGYKANIRDTDRQVLGVVTNRTEPQEPIKNQRQRRNHKWQQSWKACFTPERPHGMD